MFCKSGALLLFTLATVFSFNLWAVKNPVLPPPYQTTSTEKPPKIIGWPKGIMPKAMEGFEVSLVAKMKSPRSMLLMPNGDVLVALAMKKPGDSGEKSPNQIRRLRFKDGVLEDIGLFAEGIKFPFGMALWKNEFFVGTPTEVLKFKFEDDRLVGAPVVIAHLPFPKPARHWTRDLLLSPDGSKLYVSVGSASNVGEDGDPLDPMTAAIVEMNRDGGDMRVFAGGLRNPVAMAWEPTTKSLWTVVNERDELGDGLVPDYIARVREGGFYGWPYSYWGQHEDPRLAGQRPDLVEKAIVPDFSVGAHTASLGIAFTTGTKLAAPFNSGALITQHGSWNSSVLVGYKVLYVPFVNGEAMDPEADFLTGFIADQKNGTVYGRPVSSLVMPDGSVLVTDDGAGMIWKVSRKAKSK